jgi:HEAT repeat protein
MGIVRRPPPQSNANEKRVRYRDYDGLRASLKNPNPVARRWAARDLAAYPAAVSDLVNCLGTETESAVREALFVSLTEIGNQEAVKGLVTCLRSEDPALRNEAIDAMRNLPGAVAPIMTDLLVDPDPDVRIFAVNILESLRHPEVEAWLIKVIQEDPHINVCSTAVDLLGEVGSANAREPLEALRRRFADEPYIAFAVDLALKRIQGS